MSGLFRLIAASAAIVVMLDVQVRAQEPAPAPSSTPAQQQSAPEPNKENSTPLSSPKPIVSTTGLVHLVATVVDKHHNFITDLDKGDFKVIENGVPQDIRFFSRETDLPLRIALLLDTSNSIRPRLEFEKDAAIDFLNKVIRRDKDLAFLK